jgi:hypothetical protein
VSCWGAEPDEEVVLPELTAAGPAGRTARTAHALSEATSAGGWALLDHPLLRLEIAGSPALLEPDAAARGPVVDDPAAAAARATGRILADTLDGRHRGVVVDSPPGAGKSTLVVRAARELAAAGEKLMIVAQTNSQVDDLVDRLASADPELPLGRLHGSDSPPAPGLARHESVLASSSVGDLLQQKVMLATAAKWAYVKFPDGWEANYAVLTRLLKHRVPLRPPGG